MNKEKNIRLGFAALLAVFLLALAPQAALADLTPQEYCVVMMESMDVDIDHYKELVRIKGQSWDDAEALNRQVAASWARHGEALNVLYSAHGTTAREYQYYYNANKSQVDAFIEANGDVKEGLDARVEKMKFYVDMLEEITTYQ